MLPLKKYIFTAALTMNQMNYLKKKLKRKEKDEENNFIIGTVSGCCCCLKETNENI